MVNVDYNGDENIKYQYLPKNCIVASAEWASYYRSVKYGIILEEDIERAIIQKELFGEESDIVIWMKYATERELMHSDGFKKVKKRVGRFFDENGRLNEYVNRPPGDFTRIRVVTEVDYKYNGEDKSLRIMPRDWVSMDNTEIVKYKYPKDLGIGNVARKVSLLRNDHIRGTGDQIVVSDSSSYREIVLGNLLNDCKLNDKSIVRAWSIKGGEWTHMSGTLAEVKVDNDRGLLVLDGVTLIGVHILFNGTVYIRNNSSMIGSRLSGALGRRSQAYKITCGKLVYGDCPSFGPLGDVKAKEIDIIYPELTFKKAVHCIHKDGDYITVKFK